MWWGSAKLAQALLRTCTHNRILCNKTVATNFAEVFFLVRTVGLSKTLGNYQKGQTVAAANYKDGINAAQNWQQSAIAAGPLYAAKVQEAIANGTREKKLAQVSDATWKARASELGSQRIAGGMKAAEGKYQAAMQKNLSVIESVTLPPRSADIDANYERSKAIGKALNAASKA